MKRFERAAVVCELVARLRDEGSWAGETHIQKAIYLLQDLLEVPSAYSFILYKHGPYSFDLCDDLADFRALGLLEEQIQSPPYGPRFAITSLGQTLVQEFSSSIDQLRKAIQTAAAAIGDKNVGQVERLATALYVTRREKNQHDGSIQSRAERINKLKPHVSVESATEAVREIDALSK